MTNRGGSWLPAHAGPLGDAEAGQGLGAERSLGALEWLLEMGT